MSIFSTSTTAQLSSYSEREENPGSESWTAKHAADDSAFAAVCGPLPWLAKLLALVIFAVLAGTGPSSHAQEATIEGAVTDEGTGEALVGANLLIRETGAGTTTNLEGAYSLTVKPGRVSVRASYTGFESARQTVEIEAGETITVDFALKSELVSVDEVVVVGSRSSQRTALESPTAKDVVDGAALQSAGTGRTGEMLQKAIPSIDLPRDAMGDGTQTVRPIRMRGLGADQVLTLLNGKRRHKSAIEDGGHSAGVDMSAIPSSAIKRVEVLRDGASAQYGSDAMAGVINVILDDEPGLSVSSEAGVYSEGDGETVQLDAKYGFTIGDEGFFNLTGNFRSNELVNRTGPDNRQQYWGTVVEEGDTLFHSPEQDRLNEVWKENPERTFKMGEPERKEGGVFFNSEVPIESTGATAYSFGGVSRRNARSGCFPRLPIQSERYNVQFPDGFLPIYDDLSTDASVAAGVRGETGGWTYDVSSSYGGNFFDRRMDDTHNATYQEYSSTFFDIGTKTTQEVTSNVNATRTVETDAVSTLNISIGGEARFENYQIGAGEPQSYLDGGQKIPTGPDKGEQPAVGSQCFPGFQPSDEVDVWRQNVGGYVDVSVDITEDLLLNSAVRFENYSDFGSTFTYKVSTRYEFLDGYAIRGSFNTGFKAPSLLQSNFSSTQTGFQDIDDDGFQEGIDIRTFPLDSRAADALGLPSLDPETSVNFSGGITAEPIENMAVTIDGYHIEVKDRITSSSTFIRQSGNPIDELFSDFPELNALNAGSFLTNAFDTRAYGIDVVARYGFTLGQYGQVRLSSSFNWREREVVEGSVNELPAALEAQDVGLCGINCRMQFEEGLPQSGLSTTLNYSLGGFSVMLRGWRPGEQVGALTSDLNGDGEQQRVVLDNVNRVPPTLLIDAEVGYDFESGLSLAIGGDNIFDARPPETQQVEHKGTTFDNSYFGNWPNVNQFSNAFGVAGGFYYARIGYSF
jgi:iron complex outermembrane receptor protein